MAKQALRVFFSEPTRVIPVISLMLVIQSYRPEVYMRPVPYISLLLLLLSGCGYSGFYYQAVVGQARLVFSQQTVGDTDLKNAPQLAIRFAAVEQILDFAEYRLHLSSGKRYKKYVEVEGDFVLWNVVAAGEFSTEPEQWCFPIAGCVSYKGYFARQNAVKFSGQIQGKGLDVHVAGVAAYSTLGWFNDPLLSSYLFWPVPSLAGLLFHELAHSQLYVAGDSSFNEAFASFVEQEGVRQYMQKLANADQQQAWNVRKMQRSQFNDYLLNWKNELDLLYVQPISEPVKRLLKQQLVSEIESCYQRNKDLLGSGVFDGYFSTPLNNARIASLAAYNTQIGAFETLFKHSSSWPEFYVLAQRLADLPQKQRANRMSALLGQALGKVVVTNAGDGQHTKKIQCNTLSYHSFDGEFPGTKDNGVGTGGNR